MSAEPIYKKILRDVKVDLSDEFDRNFERKAFFDVPWKPTRGVNARGSLMARSGNLRKSINSAIEGQTIKWRSTLPYADIHNNGGDITVTVQMKKFFWAMFYKTGGAAKGATGQRKALLSNESAMWRGMALQKVGAKMKIPKRQFIGNHPRIAVSIRRAMDHNLKEIDTFIKQHLKLDHEQRNRRNF
jgi:phage gpG-like protein